MARADLLMCLVKAASTGDQIAFRRSLEGIIEEERKKQHHVLADRLSEYLRASNGNETRTAQIMDERVQGLLYEVTPRRTMDALILRSDVRGVCEELIEEHHREELLRSFGLEPRHRVLLSGPPGNGKTSLAEALAESLFVPLLVVRYEGVIGSYLGETAVRLRRVFDYVRARQCVLFFDEFDTLSKERGDMHETGEIKRVVSSLLLQIDSLPSHVITVAATNHPELLDRAVWRRFQLRLNLGLPDEGQIAEWVDSWRERAGMKKLKALPEQLLSSLSGLSFSEIEDVFTDAMRTHVLRLPESDINERIRDRIELLNATVKP